MAADQIFVLVLLLVCVLGLTTMEVRSRRRTKAARERAVETGHGPKR